MKATEFQVLVGQLGELSEAQRSALLKALSGAKNADAVIRLIETQFDASPRCGHCGSERFQKWGVDAGLKRYKCKGCSKTFNALTGTPLATLKHRDRWLAYAKALVDGVNLRKAAKRARIDLTTAFRWRHRFLKVPKTTKAAAVTGIVEADETFFLKSGKGSKKLVGREPRKRGGTAKKKGLSTDEHDAVLIVRDRHGQTTDAMLPDLQGETIGGLLRSVVAKDALLSHPKRQRLHQPPQGLDAPLQRRRHQVPRQLSRVVAHDRANGRNPHAGSSNRRCAASAVNVRCEQSRSIR